MDSSGWVRRIRSHYDYAGSGIKNLKGADVLAFQELWNLNHPGDTIDGGR